MAFLLLLFIPAGLVVACTLLGHGLGNLGRFVFRRSAYEVLFRGLAALLGAVAVAVYTWGMLHVSSSVLSAEDGGTDSSPIPSCRTPGWKERTEANGIIDYSVDYVPLRFVCETNDGGSYATDSVPGYVNPTVLVLALAATVCVGAATGGPERLADDDPVGNDPEDGDPAGDDPESGDPEGHEPTGEAVEGDDPAGNERAGKDPAA
ncbi:hypothetical protein ACFYT4_04625 [Streptomyces sp. NPDC004609]|uniref:hypothetical protein n=1 Tax=Streptomyces sp. NPDC004609 TaxID=3364704 RepID=UPI003690D58D